jgi:hypothetical protein
MLFLIFKLANEKSKSLGTVTSRPQSSPLCQPIRLGFNAGEPDGFSGPKTRNATRDYQRANNLAVDGYVGYQLLQRLKKTK